MESLIAGIGLGLMGSLHCAVMCGPIALALPIGRSGKVKRHLLHQGGRVFTYAVAGSLAGFLGAGLSFAGWQQPLSIGVGVMLLLGLLTKWPSLMRWRPYREMYSKLQHIFVAQMKGGPSYRYLFTGMINGLLPCGLVYAALLGAIGTGTALGGLSMMVGFGLGTGPILVLIGLSGTKIVEALRGKVRLAIPIVVSVMAIFFILRGLGLGIPYLSPPDAALQIQTAQESPASCH